MRLLAVGRKYRTVVLVLIRPLPSLKLELSEEFARGIRGERWYGAAISDEGHRRVRGKRWYGTAVSNERFTYIVLAIAAPRQYDESSEKQDCK